MNTKMTELKNNGQSKHEKWHCNSSLMLLCNEKQKCKVAFSQLALGRCVKTLT